MPLDKNGKAILYVPWKNKTNSKFKYFVYVSSDNKKGFKQIGFGDKDYPDWKSRTATKEQRKSYRARASGIKNKQGQLTYKLKDTKNYWSYNYLW